MNTCKHLLWVLIWTWAAGLSTFTYTVSARIYSNPKKLGNRVPIFIGKEKLREVK